ncbi:MAG: CoA-binding protein [Bacteroidota bacterium]
MSKSTLILGASSKPSRYAYLASERLQEEGHEVIALGKRQGDTAGIPIHDNPESIHLPEELDTVTLYLNPQRQGEYYDWLISLKPKRVIFNPGTENMELADKLREAGIEAVFGCTLVMLASRMY